MSPLFEFDESLRAVIEPAHLVRDHVGDHVGDQVGGAGTRTFPRRAVMCWFGDVVRRRAEGLEPVFVVRMEHGDHPIHCIEVDGVQVAITTPAVGGPAAAFTMEVLLALGATSVIGCGAAGIVRTGFDIGHVIVPTSAVRDEGTSYHYAPADVELGPHPRALEVIDAVLSEAGVPHHRGCTWSTDAFFRETVDKVARRRAQGCITVEMEAAAMFAIARLRGAVYGQLLYAGDDVSAEQWDHRHWDRQSSAREHLLDLALRAAARL